MQHTEAKKLLDKYSNGDCNAREVALLETWYLEDELAIVDLSIEDIANAKKEVWAKLPIHNKIKRVPLLLPLYSNIIRITSAAAILTVISLTGYFILNKKQQLPITQIIVANQINPGTTKATLTLSDGSSISLNDTKNGIIANESGIKITKTENGKIVYTNKQAEFSKKTEWNLLKTPAGGYYSITLADGTVAWLNASSSLKYPAEFIGSTRTVELTGEGYFEVAHVKNQPFKVITNNQTIEVLGTHFNVNAYTDENSITTTLLEGSVKLITNTGIQKILKPGYQAKLNQNVFDVKPCIAEDMTDWVKNDFVFNNEDLGSMLRKISRWYDVEIICPPELNKLEFSGSISRSKSIKQVLKMIDNTQSVHFKFEGRRIIVTK